MEHLVLGRDSDRRKDGRGGDHGGDGGRDYWRNDSRVARSESKGGAGPNGGDRDSAEHSTVEYRLKSPPYPGPW